MKSASIGCSQPAQHDQRGDRYRNGQIDWKSKSKALNLNFAREFRKHVAKIRTQNMQCGRPEDHRRLLGDTLRNVIGLRRVVVVIAENRIGLQKINY